MPAERALLPKESVASMLRPRNEGRGFRPELLDTTPVRQSLCEASGEFKGSDHNKVELGRSLRRSSNISS
jgi:hypothetical protein